MTEPETGGSVDAPPKFFRTLNGWIVGATGSVLALAGLWAAVDQIGKRMAAPAASEQGVQVAKPALAADVASAAETSPEEAEEVSFPNAYKGGGYRVAWEGDRWVETEKGEVTNRYLDGGQDAEYTIAIDPISKQEWRWPTDGGTIEFRERSNLEWEATEDSYQPD